MARAAVWASLHGPQGTREPIRWKTCRVKPNPSLKRSANGKHSKFKGPSGASRSAMTMRIYSKSNATPRKCGHADRVAAKLNSLF